jgi:protein JBTS26
MNFVKKESGKVINSD